MLLVRLLVEMVWMLLLLKAVRIVLFDSIVWQVPPRLFVQFDWWLVVEDILGAIVWIECWLWLIRLLMTKMMLYYLSSAMAQWL